MAEGSTSSGVRAQIQQVSNSLYELHRQEGTPTVQILFFHGLPSGDLSDPHLSTWKTENGSWLWEWLAEDLHGAGIYTVSYQGLTRGCDMYLIQENLIHDLMSANIGQFPYRPVILVGHCVGGLVIKAVCLQAHRRLYLSESKMEQEKLESFLENLRGIFYYSTPHHGSSRIANVSDGPLFEYFKILNKKAARLNYEFDQLCKKNKKWRIYGLGESIPTKSAEEGVDGDVEVPEASSRARDHYRVVNADHNSICQPGSKIDVRYSDLKKLINETMTITGKKPRVQKQKRLQEETVQEEKARVEQQMRVQEEAISIDLDRVTTEEKAYYMIPYLQVSDYIERIDLIESVKSAVQQRRKEGLRQVVVLLGMGGQGKSQLAMEYCRTARLSKEFQAIFWIDASSIKSAHNSFERIASKIANPLRIFESIEEKITFVKDSMNGWDSRWLLVFDNYDAPSPDFNVAKFFPSSPFGTILVTSRHEDSKRLGKVIPLSKMTEKESLELLFCRSENELTNESMEIGKSIVAKLEFLPLAIDQVGAFISAQKLPLTFFLEHFDLRKEEILKYTPALSEYRRTLDDDGKETALNVFTTLELSFQQIQKDETGKRLRSFLTTAAFFNTRDIGEDLFHGAIDLERVPLWIDAFISEGAWDSLKYRKVLVELSKLSLINFVVQETKQCRFYLHPLIADWLRLRVGRDIRQLCTIESCYLLAKLIESTDLQSCGYAFRLYLLGHADDCLNNRRMCATSLHEDGGFAKILTVQLGGLLSETSHYKEGISLVEETLPIIETTYGKDHSSTLDTVMSLGILYRDQGKLAEAEEMYQRALAGYEKALGKDNSSTLDTLNNLGLLYTNQGKLAEAEEMYQRALAGYEKAFGKDHSSTLHTVNNLSVLYRDQGKLAKAEEMYQRALAGKKKALGKDHSSTLDTVHNLGVSYKNQGKLAEAEEMYQRVLAGYEKAFGKDHSSTLDTVNNLGILYSDQGKLAQAEEMYQCALARYEKKNKQPAPQGPRQINIGGANPGFRSLAAKRDAPQPAARGAPLAGAPTGKTVTPQQKQDWVQGYSTDTATPSPKPTTFQVTPEKRTVERVQINTQQRVPPPTVSTIRVVAPVSSAAHRSAAIAISSMADASATHGPATRVAAQSSSTVATSVAVVSTPMGSRDPSPSPRPTSTSQALNSTAATTTFGTVIPTSQPIYVSAAAIEAVAVTTNVHVPTPVSQTSPSVALPGPAIVPLVLPVLSVVASISPIPVIHASVSTVATTSISISPSVVPPSNVIAASVGLNMEYMQQYFAEQLLAQKGDSPSPVTPDIHQDVDMQESFPDPNPRMPMVSSVVHVGPVPPNVPLSISTNVSPENSDTIADGNGRVAVSSTTAQKPVRFYNRVPPHRKGAWMAYIHPHLELLQTSFLELEDLRPAVRRLASEVESVRKSSELTVSTVRSQLQEVSVNRDNLQAYATRMEQQSQELSLQVQAADTARAVAILNSAQATANFETLCTQLEGLKLEKNRAIAELQQELAVERAVVSQAQHYPGILSMIQGRISKLTPEERERVGLKHDIIG